MRLRHFGRLCTVIGAGPLILAGLATAGPAGTALAGPAAHAAAAPHGIISTVIGGPGGPGPAASVSVLPCALKFAGGSLYFSSVYVAGYPANSVVDRVSQRTGLLTPVAGDGWGLLFTPPPADGTLATAASLSSACGVALDPAGNLLVAAGGEVLAVAGKTGTFYGRRMTAGRVYTLVNGLSGVQDGTGASVLGAVDVQLDAAGNLVIAEAGEPASDTNPEGDSRVLALAERTGAFYGKSMLKGRLYVIGGSLDGYTPGNAVPATQADLGAGIGTLRTDAAGNLVIADAGGNGTTGPPVVPQVRVIASRAGMFYGQRMTAGYIYTIAGGGTLTGDGVPAPQASLPAAFGVALDHAGNVLVAAGTVRVAATSNGTFYGQKMTAGRIYTLSGFQDASTRAAGVAVDSAGNVLVTVAASTSPFDPHPQYVRMLAQRTGSYYGKKARAGRIYTIAGNGKLYYSGDGGPAKAAEIEPLAVATLRSGQMTAVSDWPSDVVRVVPGRTGVFFGRPMRAGYIYTVAGAQTALGTPDALAFDPAGNLLISDAGAHLIRVAARTTATFYGQKMTAGHIYTIAGGGTGMSTSGVPARAATFGGPTAVAVDRAGNVLVLDTPLARVVAARTGTFYGQHMIAGDIYTVAGTGTSGQSGDGGPATAAEIQSQGIAVDGSGNIVLADQTRARAVAAASGTFYGRKMTAGYIYTVAGGGTRTGDGVPALKAILGPGAGLVTVDPAGNLLLASLRTVWMVAERAGSYYGKAMHAGDVYTIALDGQPYSPLGDGGPAIGAAFNAAGIAAGPAGNLLISDNLTERVRSVSR